MVVTKNIYLNVCWNIMHYHITNIPLKVQNMNVNHRLITLITLNYVNYRIITGRKFSNSKSPKTPSWKITKYVKFFTLRVSSVLRMWFKSNISDFLRISEVDSKIEFQGGNEFSDQKIQNRNCLWNWILHKKNW